MSVAKILGCIVISVYFIGPVISMAALWETYVAQSAAVPQIVVPCEVVEVYDGDTVTVRLTINVRVRLLDCWAPEVKTKDGTEKAYGIHARETLKELVDGEKCLLTVPLENVDRLDDVFTFGRVLGDLRLLNGLDAADEMVRMGAAAREKP